MIISQEPLQLNRNSAKLLSSIEPKSPILFPPTSPNHKPYNNPSISFRLNDLYFFSPLMKNNKATIQNTRQSIINLSLIEAKTPNSFNSWTPKNKSPLAKFSTIVKYRNPLYIINIPLKI